MIVEDHMISVQVNGVWVRIMHDGSIVHEMDGDMTYVEAMVLSCPEERQIALLILSPAI